MQGFNNLSTPWTGTSGITSATAAATDAAPGAKLTGLGYAEASSVGITGSYNGQTVDANTIIVRYTYLGDANLDGKVNAQDFAYVGRQLRQYQRRLDARRFQL